MPDYNNQVWAKDNGVSLKQHTEDILKAFTKVKDNIKNNDDTKTCIEWAIKFHDLGKVLPYFQIVVLGNTKYEPWNVNKDLNIYHSLASILFINQDKLSERLSNDEKNLEYILSAIAYHHWKNSLEMDLRYGSEKFEKLLQYETNKLVDKLKTELNGLFDNEDKDTIQFNKDMLQGLANGLSFSDYIIPPYQLYWLPKRIELDEEGKKKWVLISGFLQRCDHYASFCEEEENWSQKQEDEKNEILNKIEIENIEIDQIGNKIKEEIKNKLNNSQNTKDSQDISLWQESKLKEKENEKFKYQDNLILVAPTGSGKTEFAFLWSGGEKFFYTLPLRSAVEQIYDRATKIFGEDKVGLLHSDADVYLLGDNYNYERIKVYEVARQLSYPVIVSTGDQFFPYGLRPPGYERIYATFSYSRLVIDEIQAYDPKAIAIIIKFIEDIHRLGGKFLLMTATLPEYARQEVKKRLKSNGKDYFEELNIYEEKREDYKKNIKHKIEFLKVSNKLKTKEVDFTIPDNILSSIVSKASNYARVLVILNTINQAVNVYEKIKSLIWNSSNLNSENIILFHSQFPLKEKKRIKEKIEEKFKNPKDQNDKEGKILIATQVVEAAIDIDADVLYTEICPMDALVQRMGRVLRRYKENFSLNDNAEPNVNVFVFKEGYESGNGRVYDRELIEKTLILLKEKTNNTLNFDNYYDDFKKEKEKLKKSVDIIPNTPFELSEYDKYELVINLYRNINPYGKYLSKFYETLVILDAGFMSDRKEEAQRIFREILNANVVEVSKEEQFKDKIKKLIEENGFSYTKFKKEIIAEFVIPIPYWKLEKIKVQVATKWVDEINISGGNQISNSNSDEKNRRLKKIKEWCSDIFIANFRNINSENIINESTNFI